MKMYLLPIFLISFMAFGQQPSIALQSIEAVNKEKDYVEAEMIFQKVKDLFVNTNRFRILDRESLGVVLDEQEIQKQITSLNADVVRQGQIAGAENIIGGKLISLEYKKVGGVAKKVNKLLFGKDSKQLDENLYRPVFTFSLNVINTETSETMNSHTFRVGTLDTKSLGGISRQEAFQNALNSLEDEIRRDFIDEFLAEAIAVVNVEEEKNGEATVLLIHTGNASGAEENDKYKVYQISSYNLDGREIKREKEIAQIKILDVEGDELSTAEVLNGGGDVLENFKAGEKLICKSE
ncbi:MAG: CsgG/HfaB family protein [Salegentibacter sp.]